jgi:hypothetical protein
MGDARRGETGEPEDFMTRKEEKKLFAEWEKDCHAARVRDYGKADAATYKQRVREGAMMPLTDGPPHPWPSEIARANREKESGQEQGKGGGNEKTNDRDDGASL